MPALTADVLSVLLPLSQDPARGAVLCDIDGTLAPIAARPEDASVPKHVSQLLGDLARRYACVACITGRPAEEARRLVGQRGIAYAGLYGLELLAPGQRHPQPAAAFKDWEMPVQRFSASHTTEELRGLGVRFEAKGPIAAFHWRGAPDEDAALAALQGVAREAQSAGLAAYWGRKVLEVRPPVPINKGQAVRELVGIVEAKLALYGGDDTTDLDAFNAVDALVAERKLDTAVRVGVRSDEGPLELVQRADVVVDDVAGFARVLDSLLPG